MLLKYFEPGHYDDCQQFETIQKLCLGYQNVYMSSMAGAVSLISVSGENAKQFLKVCPTHFEIGCLHQMGQEV